MFDPPGKGIPVKDEHTVSERQEEQDVLFGVINRFIGYFTQQSVPKSSNDSTCEYPFVAMDTRQAYEQLRCTRGYLSAQGALKPGLKFIDIGCGIGNILLLAEMMDFNVFGIEKDAASVEFAKQLIGENKIDQADIWQFSDWSAFDIIYYFRPFAEKTRQLSFERLVEDRIKPGAILIANRKMDHAIDRDSRFCRLDADWPIWLKRNNPE